MNSQKSKKKNTTNVVTIDESQNTTHPIDNSNAFAPSSNQSPSMLADPHDQLQMTQNDSVNFTGNKRTESAISDDNF